MISNSRVKNTKNNIISGMINMFINMLFPFIIRTCILYYLSDKYLGLSSLFSSILQILNLAELGFSNAIVYNMYKPIAENNYEMVGSYLNYYKKVYFRVGCLIMFFGLIILPFITFFINESWPQEINIYILYLLYLFDSSISYFLFAYKSSLLTALQKYNVVNNFQSIFWIIKFLIQILCIVLLKNYYLFVIASIFSTIMINISCSIYVDKHYSKYKSSSNLSKNERKKVKEQVNGLMIGKLSDVSRNSFDSVILSSFFGLSVVAIYNNYYYIFSAIYSVLLVLTSSMQASIGNSIAKETIEKNYNDLLTFNFIFSFIICFCCVSLLSLYQPFMRIWVGNELLLSDFNVILLTIYFFVLNINDSRNLYFTGSGLWWKAKKSFIFEALANLLLNIVLGKIFGITGVIVATIITIFIFNYIVRTNILFKNYFKFSPAFFYKKTFYYGCVIFILCLISLLINKFISVNGYIGLIVYLLLSIIISLLFVIPFIKSKEFKNLLVLLNKLIKRKQTM